MGGHKTISGSSYPTPAAPVPAADYHVEVNPELMPNCSGNYFYAGELAAKPYYRRADDFFFIWFYSFLGDNFWAITTILNYEEPGWWSVSENIIGTYNPVGFAGHAIVSAGPL